MFKKDRKIANQKAMIENRDDLIEELRAKIKLLKEENIAVYEENKELRFENEELNDVLKDIVKLTESNTYNNGKVIFNKIKELAKTAIQH